MASSCGRWEGGEEDAHSLLSCTRGEQGDYRMLGEEGQVSARLLFYFLVNNLTKRKKTAG